MERRPAVSFGGAQPPGFEEITETPKPDGLTCSITLNGKTYPGKLPLMPRRMVLVLASGSADWYVAACVRSAMVAMCWDGPDLGIGDWRKDHDRDLVGYGEVAMHVFMTQYGATAATLIEETTRLADQIAASMPSADEVEEAREDFSDDRPDNSGEAVEEAVEALTELNGSLADPPTKTALAPTT